MKHRDGWIEVHRPVSGAGENLDVYVINIVERECASSYTFTGCEERRV